MAKAEYFPAGARVVVRDEEWLVTRCDRVANGGYALHLTGLSGIVREKETIYLAELEDRVEELKPEATTLEWDTSPKHRRARLYLEALLRATPPTDSGIYLGHRGVLRQARFQLEPARLALEALRPRILIADGVGLGKTLEVGILLSELIRRGQGTRILVVALKSLLAQFQQELWARFAIPLVRLDSQGIERLRRRIPASRNPFTVVDKAIISIDTLKDDGRYRHFLEHCRFDAVVIDECHNVANSDTDRGRLAALLAERTDALIMTSATPHNGRPASFATLVNMLEPTAIANPDDYTADDIRGLYVRRFKKDIRHEVEDEFTERDLAIDRVPAGPAEEAVFDRLATLKFRVLDHGRPSGNSLFRTTLIKAWLSSPDACRETIDTRTKTLTKRDGPRREGTDADLAALADLRTLVELAAAAPTAKERRLLALLRERGYAKERGPKAHLTAPRILIFSERVATLRRLESLLCTEFGLTAEQVKIFTSDGLSDVEQQTLVEDFGKQDSPLRFLLATDVASEGVNLHFYCHHLLHFDLPWSPIVIEQRNGRIDRFGQQQVPWIRYLVTDTQHPSLKGDLRILDVLVEKEAYAHQNLGDAALLMGLHSSLSEERRIAQALESGARQLALVFEPPKEEKDLIDLLLAGTAPPFTTDPCATAPTLFPDDFDFVRTALSDLAPSLTGLAPEIHAPSQSVKLTVPPDQASLALKIPPEAWPQGDRFHLSADRTLLAAAIENARKRKGEWPAVQLLWELHPIFRWIVDKVLVGFERHTAPLIASDHVAPGEVVWLLLGSFGNRRGQTWLAEWFGVRCRPLQKPEILDFPAFVAATHLGQAANVADRNASVPSTVKASLGSALDAAQSHLARRFADREAALEARSREFFQRLDTWHQSAARLADQKKADLRARGIVRGALAEAADLARRHLDELLATRKQWAAEILSPASAVPYLRVAAAVVAPPA